MTTLTTREAAIIAFALYTLKLDEASFINASQTEINDLAQKLITESFTAKEVK